MMHKRCEYVMDRAQTVLDYCREPRLMRDIISTFNARQTRFTVHNLVKRGKLINLNAGRERETGMYIAAEKLAGCRAAKTKTARSDGTALAAAWS